MWPIILIEEFGLFEGLRQIVIGQIWILIRPLFFCLDRAPNSIRVHWDQIVWRLSYDQGGEGGKTTSSFINSNDLSTRSFLIPIISQHALIVGTNST